MQEESKDSTNVASNGCSGGPPPITPGATSTQPPPDDDMNGHTGSPSSGNLPSSGEVCDLPVPSKRVEANRKNAQKSTGPRSEAGKAKAAKNSYKHGIFSKYLFSSAGETAKDRQDYLDFANDVCNYYEPVGFMESFWAEKIASEAFRFARLVGYEQSTMMAWRYPFESRAAGAILRYQTRANSGMTDAMKELERVQAKRKAEEVSTGPDESEENNATEEVEGPTPCPDEPDGGASTADDAVAESGSAVTAAEAQSEGTEASGSNASAEMCGTNPPVEWGRSSK